MDPGGRKFLCRYRLRWRRSDDEGQSARVRRGDLRPENAEAPGRRILSKGERPAAFFGRPLHLRHWFCGRSQYRALLQQARSEVSGETVFDLGANRLRETTALLDRAVTCAIRESPQSAKLR